MLLNVSRVVARRWYIVLVGLLLTSGLGYGATLAVSPDYTSRALILVLPAEEAVGADGNPFLALGGLEQPASLVTAYFRSTTAQQEVAERSATASYLVALDEQVRGPVILVQVTDTTAEQSLLTLDYLTERIPEELARLQEEVRAPESSTLQSMLLNKDVEAVEDSGATTRLVIAAVAAGLVGTAFLAFWLDGVLTRRAARRPVRSRSRGETTAASRPIHEHDALVTEPSAEAWHLSPDLMDVASPGRREGAADRASVLGDGR